MAPEDCGAEVLPILKGFIVVPVTFCFLLFYMYLSSGFKESIIFYRIMTFLGTVFFVYALFLLPNESKLTPHNFLAALGTGRSIGSMRLLAVFKHWIRSLFFVLAELWSQAVEAVLFWGLANRVCSLEEAKENYGFFVASGTLSIAFMTAILYYFLGYTDLSLETIVQGALLYAALGVVVIMLVYQRLIQSLDKQKVHATNFGVSMRSGILSIKERLGCLVKSRYLMTIAIMAFSLSMIMNLMDTIWQASLKAIVVSGKEIVEITSLINFILNLLILFMTLLMFKKLLKKKGWTFSAQAAPFLMGTVSLIFLIVSSMYYQRPGSFLAMHSPLPVLGVGVFYIMASKVAKFAFYNPTKEMAFIPLDPTKKIQGKATIDVLVLRLGKAVASYIYLFLLWITDKDNILDIIQLLIPIVLAVLVLWIYAVNYIGKRL